MATLKWTTDVQRKMMDRQITEAEVEAVLAANDEIESTPERRRHVLFARVNDRPLHVVYADEDPDVKVIISTYDPSLRPDLWSADFRTRKTS